VKSTSRQSSSLWKKRGNVALLATWQAGEHITASETFRYVRLYGRKITDTTISRGILDDVVLSLAGTVAL